MGVKAVATSESWRDKLWPEWQVECEIGSGSFAKVYKIRRQDIGGTYYAALKVIPVPGDTEELGTRDPQAREKLSANFLGFAKELSREFALMERLKGNSNIVSYEDHKIVGRSDGFGWDVLIRMELLTPMLDHLGRSDCPEPEAIRLGLDICSALVLCQRENIIHRDIKPGNIFVNHFGDYKLGDFGVAMNTGLGWQERSARGTYPYMAPEMFRGKSYDATIDIYALGLILYRLMNHGRAPFLPPPPEVLNTRMVEEAHSRRLSGEPLPPPRNASRALAAVILRACDPDPRRRYPTAADFRQALEHCAGRIPERPMTATLSPAAPAPARREESTDQMDRMFQFAGDL